MRARQLVPVLGFTLGVLALTLPAEAGSRGGGGGRPGPGGGGIRGGFGGGFHGPRGGFGGGFHSPRGGFGGGFHRPRGGFHGGFRGRRNDFNFHLGFGRGRHFSSVSFGYPFYSWYPTYGYPFGYPFGYGSYYYPVASPTLISPYLLGSYFGYWGYPNYAYAQQSVPAVVDASQVIVNAPAAAPGRLQEVPPPGADRYYLDRRPAQEPPARPLSLLDLARTQIRVELAEAGMYFVRWTGPAEELRMVEFQAVDETGQVLASRLLREAPFRGLLRVPEKTAAVLVTVEQKSGASASVKLPLAEFKALEEK